MKGQFFIILLVGAIVFGFDMYLKNGFKAAFKKRGFAAGKRFNQIYITISLVLILGVMACVYFRLPVALRAAFMLGFFVLLLVKAAFLPWVLVDDIRRLIIHFKKPQSIPAFPN